MSARYCSRPRPQRNAPARGSAAALRRPGSGGAGAVLAARTSRTSLTRLCASHRRRPQPSPVRTQAQQMRRPVRRDRSRRCGWRASASASGRSERWIVGRPAVGLALVAEVADEAAHEAAWEGPRASSTRVRCSSRSSSSKIDPLLDRVTPSPRARSPPRLRRRIRARSARRRPSCPGTSERASVVGASALSSQNACWAIAEQALEQLLRRRVRPRSCAPCSCSIVSGRRAAAEPTPAGARRRGLRDCRAVARTVQRCRHVRRLPRSARWRAPSRRSSRTACGRAQSRSTRGGTARPTSGDGVLDAHHHAVVGPGGDAALGPERSG